MHLPPSWQPALQDNIRQALKEDIGTGDISAQLIDPKQRFRARVITRDDAILAGQPWVDAVFQTLDAEVNIHWHFNDGDSIKANDCLFELEGQGRSLLTGERTALNFLQTLSAVATRTAEFVERVKGTGVTLLDTRKTLPGLRMAQKYAVQCGGGKNHRLGLYDAFLIKENHIAACGSITNAIARAREIAPEKTLEIEVENLTEFNLAMNAGADIIMLDNFSNIDKVEAVKRNRTHPLADGQTRPRLEASGGINADTLLAVAQTGVDYISTGILTKDIQAVDLSMRISR